MVAAAVRLQAALRGRNGRRVAHTARERRREEQRIASVMGRMGQLGPDAHGRRRQLQEVLSVLNQQPEPGEEACAVGKPARAAAAALCATPVAPDDAPMPAEETGLKLVLQVERRAAGNGGSARRRRYTHTPRGVAGGGGSSSLSVMIPWRAEGEGPEAERSTASLLRRAEAAAVQCAGGAVVGGWSYATSRGEIVDMDEYTEVGELRRHASYLFNSVRL